MAVSRLCPLALAFSVALIIAVSTVYTFINGYSEGLVYKFKRNGEQSKKNPNLDKESTFPYKNIRLPNHIRPLSYDVYIHPNLTTFKFSGKVKILLQCVQPTKNVILHLRDLRVEDVKMVDSKQNSLKIARRVELKKNQQYLIAVEEELGKVETYELYLEFKGALSNNMEGFYKSSYKTKDGQERYLATTQFEATHARSAFPCFDEPAFKAVFRITVVHDVNHTALSNMPLESHDRRHDGLLESQFSASVPMATYLVAFIVCDFDYKETITKSGKKIRVWSKPDAIDSADFALDAAKHALEYYEDFFNVSYPLPKMDLIAIPDMGGAMENWGLVTFRESAMLFDPATGSAADQKLVAMIVDHEFAHQWFGNLVTMGWWNDLWLNEGFAVYMEYLATDSFNKKWKRAEQFMLDSLREALDVDSSLHTHPVSVEVHNPAQINEIVDKITYLKSSAVIRMMKSFLGVETFRKGIQIYLEEHQFSDAKASDLWKAMTAASGNRVDVAAIMDSWLTQKGFPVIKIFSNEVQKKDRRLSYTASQKRFFRDLTSAQLKNDHMKEGRGWYVPLTYITEGSLDNCRTVWMNKSSVTFQLPSSTSGWVKANVGQTGFYRVNYDEENWKLLSQQLLHNHKVLSASDRSGLIDDALSLARAGVLDYHIALGMTEYIKHEREYVPWAVTLRTIAYIGTMLSSRSSYKVYQQFIVEKVKPLEAILGWEDTGEMIDKFLRELALSALCFHGDTEAVKKSQELFNDWMRTNGSHSIAPHLRKTVYVAAIRHGGAMEWKFLREKYKGCKDAAEREKMISALGAARSKDKLHRLLTSALDKTKVRSQDMIQVIGTVANNPEGRQLAWEFFVKNFNKIVKRLGKESRGVLLLLERTTENLHTPKHLKEVKDFIQKHHAISQLESNKKILETVQTNIHWVKTQVKHVEKWFENRH